MALISRFVADSIVDPLGVFRYNKEIKKLPYEKHKTTYFDCVGPRNFCGFAWH